MKWLLLAVLFLESPLSAAQSVEDANCKLVEGATIYSEAVYVEEAGDVVGFELALFKDGRALLFNYEGTIDSEPISLTTQGPSRKSANGSTTYMGFLGSPSPHELVRVRGTFVNLRFVGTVQISGAVKKVRMRKVDHLWGCRRNG